jgi:hypothetical protein
VKGTLMVFFSVGAVSSLEDVAGFSKGRLIKCTTHCARPLRHFLLKLKSIVVMRFEIYTLSFFPFFPQFLFLFHCNQGCNGRALFFISALFYRLQQIHSGRRIGYGLSNDDAVGVRLGFWDLRLKAFFSIFS